LGEVSFGTLNEVDIEEFVDDLDVFVDFSSSNVRVSLFTLALEILLFARSADESKLGTDNTEVLANCFALCFESFLLLCVFEFVLLLLNLRILRNELNPLLMIDLFVKLFVEKKPAFDEDEDAE
jgi:hypothetical protein